MSHLHVIGIGGIGVSAIARYYQSLGSTVSGSDGSESHLIDTLRSEGMQISIGHRAENVPPQTDLIIYSEAIITKPDLPPAEQIYANPELALARDRSIRHISYPVALAEIFDQKKWIAVTGSHGKSTTTAMIATMMAGSSVGISAIVGTQVPQLGGTNFYHEDSPYFVIEACEYKRSFLQYHPWVTIITNIDLDHLDYYRDLDDYISAFQSIVDQTRGFVVISNDDAHSSRLQIPREKKIVVGGGRISYERKIEYLDGETGDEYERVEIEVPSMGLLIPWEHIHHDAELAYAVGRLCGLDSHFLIERLEDYQGSWRRSEIIRTTRNGNLLMSDYGHHPSEIRPTLRALREKYRDKRLIVVFQPHQYSRTRELLSEFASAFSDLDRLIIPNIYFSRDKQSDVEWMTVSRLIETIRPHQPHIEDGRGLEHTAEILHMYDRENTNSSVILLLGAGDVDTLRDEIW